MVHTMLWATTSILGQVCSPYIVVYFGRHLVTNCYPHLQLCMLEEVTFSYMEIEKNCVNLHGVVSSHYNCPKLYTLLIGRPVQLKKYTLVLIHTTRAT